MSAFIVSDLHIATMLVTYRDLMGTDSFNHRLKYRLGAANIDQAAVLLMRENIRSVNSRYSTRTKMPKAISFAGAGAKAITIPQLVMLIQCYDYQSCEHKGWRTSKAKEFIDAMREDILIKVIKLWQPDLYESASWSI